MGKPCPLRHVEQQLTEEDPQKKIPEGHPPHLVLLLAAIPKPLQPLNSQTLSPYQNQKPSTSLNPKPTAPPPSPPQKKKEEREREKEREREREREIERPRFLWGPPLKKGPPLSRRDARAGHAEADLRAEQGAGVRLGSCSWALVV